MESDAANVLVVQISPTRTQEAPRDRHEIERRIDQINFNSSLEREIEAIRLLAPLLRRRRRLGQMVEVAHRQAVGGKRSGAIGHGQPGQPRLGLFDQIARRRTPGRRSVAQRSLKSIAAPCAGARERKYAKGSFRHIARREL